MKKTNKRLAALSALGLFLMCGITFVGCDKDNTEPANDSRTEVVTEKSANANIYELAKNSTVDLCRQIDAAYTEDPELFRTICESEDFDAFINLIGITESDIENHNNIMKTACEMFLAENPDLDTEVTDTCTECRNNPLTNIYNARTQIPAQDGMTEIASDLSDFDIITISINCDKLCSRTTSNDDAFNRCKIVCEILNILLNRTF